MALSTLRSEDDVRPFSFYWKGKIHTGMVLHGRLYGLLDYYSSAHRAKAFEQGYALSARHEVVVTVERGTHTVYKLWVGLNSRTEALLASQNHIPAKPSTTQINWPAYVTSSAHPDQSLTTV